MTYRSHFSSSPNTAREQPRRPPSLSASDVDAVGGVHNHDDGEYIRPIVRPCGHNMLAALTAYRNRLREWLQEAAAVTASGNNRAPTVDDHEDTVVGAVASTTIPSATTDGPDTSGVQSRAETSQSSQSRQRDETLTPSPLSPRHTTATADDDEGYTCTSTVLSSMPEDLPLPPLAYTRRRSSSKTHTRLYRIRLPPKPRRAKR